MGDVIVVVRNMARCPSVQEPRIIRKVCGHHNILVTANRVVEWLFWIVGVQVFWCFKMNIKSMVARDHCMAILAIKLVLWSITILIVMSSAPWTCSFLKLWRWDKLEEMLQVLLWFLHQKIDLNLPFFEIFYVGAKQVW